jgi:hypothetical protein
MTDRKDMRTLRDFEVAVIRSIAASALSQDQIDAIAACAGDAEYRYTGSGYFLTLRMATLPADRQVLSSPTIMGEADGIRCGFVVFLEYHELTFECHSWGDIDLPSDFRDRNVVLSTLEPGG